MTGMRTSPHQACPPVATHGLYKKPPSMSHESAAKAPKKKRTSSASLSASSKKRQQAGNPPEMEFLMKYLEGSNEDSQAQAREMERHHKKWRNWKSRSSEQVHRSQTGRPRHLSWSIKKLVETKIELEREELDKEAILAMFPDMAPLSELEQRSTIVLKKPSL